MNDDHKIAEAVSDKLQGRDPFFISTIIGDIDTRKISFIGTVRYWNVSDKKYDTGFDIVVDGAKVQIIKQSFESDSDLNKDRLSLIKKWEEFR